MTVTATAANQPVEVPPRAQGSRPIVLLLSALALIAALSPGFGVGSLFLNLSEAPILLLWLLMRWQRSLMLTLFCSALALLVWGLESPVIWLSVYGNTLLLIALLVLVRRLFVIRDLSILAFSYWFFVGAPLTFLIFVVNSGNVVEAGIASSVRIASALLSVSLGTMAYLAIIAARPHLPDRLFPNPERLIIGLDGLGRHLGSFLIPIPTVLFILFMANVMVGDRLQMAHTIANHELDQAWHLYHESRHNHLDPTHQDAGNGPAAVRTQLVAALNEAANVRNQNAAARQELLPIYLDLAPDCTASTTIKHFGLPEDARVVQSEPGMVVWIPASAIPDGDMSPSPVMRGRHELVTLTHNSSTAKSHFAEGQCLRATYRVWDALKGKLSIIMWWMWAATGFLLLMELFIWWFVQLFSAPLKEVAVAMGHFSERQGAGESSEFQFKSHSRLDELDILIAGFKDMEAHISGFSNNLRTLNSNYESLLDQTAVGFAAIDQFGNLTYRNDSIKILTDRVPDLLEQIEQLHAGAAFEIRPLTIKLPRDQIDLLTGVIDRLDANGRIDGYWVVATDVTTLRSTEAQLIQSQKMATLGEMATGVAHEINQPLQAIRLALANMARQLDKDPPDFDRIREKIGSSVEQVYRVAELVKHMKSFGRTSGTEHAPFLPDATIQTLTDAWRENYASAGVSLSLDLRAGEAAKVMGNRNQFEQVIINLLQNSRDAAEQHRKLTHVTLSSRASSTHYELNVTDRSGGIPDDVIDHIFTPFFTTKDPDKGTGIGLSISYTIIRDMAGTFTVANVGRDEQRGARFTLTLPLTRETLNILE